MQNRRLLYDDWRGVGEALNETNKDGTGIEVNAEYKIFFTTNEFGSTNTQRKIQQEIDTPPLLFASKSPENIKNQCPCTDFDFSDLSGVK